MSGKSPSNRQTASPEHADAVRAKSGARQIPGLNARPLDAVDPEPAPHAPISEELQEFYTAIDRHHLAKKLSPTRPYVYTTMEIYDAKNGIRGAGGLGVLAADTRRVAEQLSIPLVVLTPFYREELEQTMVDLQPQYVSKKVAPADFGFTKRGECTVKSAGNTDSVLEIWQKVCGSTQFLTIGEANFGRLYQGDGSSDHRLYQMISLGFGGYHALKLLDLKPAVMQLNETATVFAAVARLDELCMNGMELYEAIVYVRKHTLYTNHTLVQAAEGEFTRGQFNEFVFPNIQSPALKHFIESLFVNEHLKLSSLTIELAEPKNGVSRLHAQIAD
jgi:glucan phosphorylase